MLGYKILSTGALVAVGAVTARQLQPAGRGVFVLLVSIASFALVISSLGVNVSARVQLVAPEDPVSSGDYIGLSSSLGVIQVLLCMVAGLTLLPAAKVHLPAPFLLLFGLLGGALLVQYLLNDALNSFGFTTLATAVDAGGSGAQLLLVLALAFAGSHTISLFVAALLAGNAIQVVLALVALRHVEIAIRPRFDPISWRRLVRTGFPGILSTLGQLLTFRVDRYLIGLFLNPTAVGLYSVAATAPELLRLPALALGQPILYRLAAGSATVHEFQRVRNLCVAGTMASAALMFAAAPLAVRTVFGADYAASVMPLRVLLLGEAGIALFYIDGASLAGMNHLKKAALAAMTGLVAVSLLDVALIPHFGLAGAAWASVAAYSMMGGVATVLVRRVPRPDPTGELAPEA